jgi:hydroxymethylpyrimidine/phosphomethylpyrimidine kinase
MAGENRGENPPVCLTIGGLDPSGGAGIVADIKTFTAYGCFAAAVASSVTFQNTTGVFGAVHQTADSIRRQSDPIFVDYEVAAAKTGMLPTREVIEESARIFRERQVVNLVVDPVVRSTSGFDLIDDSALSALIDTLFPLALVITPNIPEAERIAGMSILSNDDILRAARKIRALGARNVLIKGGHFTAYTGRVRMSIDHLFEGDRMTLFEDIYVVTTATHGTGCTLAAAITANLALGLDLNASVAGAKTFVHDAIKNATSLGKGNSPLNIR